MVKNNISSLLQNSITGGAYLALTALGLACLTIEAKLAPNILSLGAQAVQTFGSNPGKSVALGFATAVMANAVVLGTVGAVSLAALGVSETLASVIDAGRNSIAASKAHRSTP